MRNRLPGCWVLGYFSPSGTGNRCCTVDVCIPDIQHSLLADLEVRAWKGALRARLPGLQFVAPSCKSSLRRAGPGPAISECVLRALEVRGADDADWGVMGARPLVVLGRCRPCGGR